MKQGNADYKVVPFSKMRRLEAVTIRSALRTPIIHGLIEVDVTRARAFLPIFLFRFLWRMREYPQLQKKYWGTVVLTAVGMFGKGAGWGIPISGDTLSIMLGGIAEKPGVVDGHIAIREYLSLTISFDHNIIDGAPAARFTERLWSRRVHG
jgi:hypothetical protein